MEIYLSHFEFLIKKCGKYTYKYTYKCLIMQS